MENLGRQMAIAAPDYGRPKANRSARFHANFTCLRLSNSLVLRPKLRILNYAPLFAPSGENTAMSKPLKTLLSPARLMSTLLLALISVSACSGESAAYTAIKEELWAKEQSIYKARESGDLGVYISLSSEHYMGWPPGWPTPSDLDKLRAGAEGMKGMDGERLTMTYKDMALSADGNTAIIYYSTHRTSDPTGKEVDQYFDVSHVWVKEDGEWKLMGSMGRDSLQ